MLIFLLSTIQLYIIYILHPAVLFYLASHRNLSSDQAGSEESHLNDDIRIGISSLIYGDKMFSFFNSDFLSEIFYGCIFKEAKLFSC